MFLCRVPRFEKMNEGFGKIISKIFTDSKLLNKTLLSKLCCQLFLNMKLSECFLTSYFLLTD